MADACRLLRVSVALAAGVAAAIAAMVPRGRAAEVR